MDQNNQQNLDNLPPKQNLQNQTVNSRSLVPSVVPFKIKKMATKRSRHSRSKTHGSSNTDEEESKSKSFVFFKDPKFN